MTFNFSDLLAKALLDWPDEIDLSPLMRSGNDPMRYSIQGLGQMSDSITERYIGTSEEVMLRNLHEAIYEVLHGAAAYTTRIRMSELRSEAIRSKFEKRLQNAMQIPELDYNPEDIQLIQKYFERNQ